MGQFLGREPYFFAGMESRINLEQDERYISNFLFLLLFSLFAHRFVSKARSKETTRFYDYDYRIVEEVRDRIKIIFRSYGALNE